MVYYLRPCKQDLFSYNFLCSRVDKDSTNVKLRKMHSVGCKKLMKYQKSIIQQDLIASNIYESIKTEPTIYTLKQDSKNIINFPFYSLLSNEKYYARLQEISSLILRDLTEKIEQKNIKEERENYD